MNSILSNADIPSGENDITKNQNGSLSDDDDITKNQNGSLSNDDDITKNQNGSLSNDDDIMSNDADSGGQQKYDINRMRGIIGQKNYFIK